MSLLPRFYPGPVSRDFSVYVLTFDDTVLEFSTFSAAKEHLLTELWWLAEDYDHEPTRQAWNDVLRWAEGSGFPQSIVAGDPAAKYTLDIQRPRR